MQPFYSRIGTHAHYRAIWCSFYIWEELTFHCTSKHLESENYIVSYVHTGHMCVYNVGFSNSKDIA